LFLKEGTALVEKLDRQVGVLFSKSMYKRLVVVAEHEGITVTDIIRRATLKDLPKLEQTSGKSA
jgi:hypothetical protein